MDLTITWFVAVGGDEPQGSPSPPHLAPATPFSSRVWFGSPLPYVLPVSYQFLRGDYGQALGRHRPLAPAGLPIPTQFPLGQARPDSTNLPWVRRPYLSRRSRAACEPLHVDGSPGAAKPPSFPLHFETSRVGRHPHSWVAPATCPHHRPFHPLRQCFSLLTTGERRMPLPGATGRVRVDH